MMDIEKHVMNLEIAKKAENEAKAARIYAEEQIAKLLDGPEEGSKTHIINDYKVTVKRVIYRTVNDYKALENVHQDFVIFKPSLNVKQVKEWREEHPSIYAKAAEFITAMEGKTSVTLKRIKPAELEVAA